MSRCTRHRQYPTRRGGRPCPPARKAPLVTLRRGDPRGRPPAMHRTPWKPCHCEVSAHTGRGNPQPPSPKPPLPKGRGTSRALVEGYLRGMGCSFAGSWCGDSCKKRPPSRAVSPWIYLIMLIILRHRSSFRSFSPIQPQLRRGRAMSQLRIAGRTKQISTRPSQSVAVMAALVPASISASQPVYTPI